MTKFYSNPISFTSQFTHCALPFRLDSYKGCYFRCKYCYTDNVNRSANRKFTIPTKLEIIQLAFKRAFKGNSANENNIEINALRNRIPIHFGGMSDPFPPIELKNHITLNILKILKEYSYPVVISTKSVFPLKDEYFKLLSELPFLSIQTSISPLSLKYKKVELNTPSHKARINMLKIFSEIGIHTTCRFQPIFYDLIDNYIYDLIQNLSDSGCKHIITEGYKHYAFTKDKNKESLNDALNIEIQKEMKLKGGKFKGPYMEYPTIFKLKYLMEIIKMIRKAGMTFGSGDNDLRHLGDNPCCCGVDGLPGFDNWFKYQFSTAIFRHDSDNLIHFSSIEDEWYPKGNVSSIMNSNSIERKSNNLSIKSVIRAKWNNPEDKCSLTRFWKISPYQKDKKGMFIYKLDSDFNYVCGKK